MEALKVMEALEVMEARSNGRWK